MSQEQNNRISYASIAGRNTKKNFIINSAETSRSQSNTQLNTSVNTIENDEYPPIIAQGPSKPKNNHIKKAEENSETAKSEPPLETAIAPEIVSIEVSKSEPIQTEEIALNIALSELAVEGNGSKIDSPQSQPESAQGADMSENDITPQTRPKSWSALFKKSETQLPVPVVDMISSATGPPPDDSFPNITQKPENTPEIRENSDDCGQTTENKEDRPSYSQTYEPAPTQPIDDDSNYIPQDFDDSTYYPMGINMLPMGGGYVAPQYNFPQYGYMVPPPMIPAPTPYYPQQGYIQGPPMDQMPPLSSNVPPGPSGAIAHPVHGMVYYQYDSEMPVDAMMSGLYPQVLIPQPIQRPIKPLMSLQTNQYQDGVTEAPKIDGWNNAADALMFEQKIAGKMDLLICDRYQTYLKISRGSCGTVFAAVDLLDPNRTVAIKFEEFSTTRSNLAFEYEAYKNCSTSEMNDIVHGTPTEGFARIYWMGSQYKYKILIMELLGPSLENLFQYSMREFSPETVFRLGNQMIDRIEHFHRAGFIHRDVKPDNFAVGLGHKEDIVYLIDFGLSRRFRDIGDKDPLYRKDKSLVGTAKYASINSHKGMQLARRDDLESIGYILVEFINGELPWKAENWANCSRDTIYKNMLELKKTTNWSLKCPKMAEWMKYVAKLSFDDMPNYNYLRELLVKFLESAQPNRFSSLAEHMSKCTFPISQQSKRKKSQREEKNDREREKIDIWKKVEQSRFEWKIRREFCPNDRYSYECLFRWTLPYGQEPQRPPGLNPSNVFGTGPGEGGFA